MADQDLSKMAALAKRLLERTEQCRLDWQPTDQAETYATVLTTGSVSVASLGDGRYKLTAVSDQGTVLDEVVSQEQAVAYDRAPNMAVVSSTLPKLYSLARKEALKVGDALDHMLDELRDG